MSDNEEKKEKKLGFITSFNLNSMYIYIYIYKQLLFPSNT